MSATLTEIPRLRDHDAVTARPGWYACVDGGGRPVKPYIRCNCGRLMGIKDHHLHADGRVTASFYDRDGCGWHVWLKLLDYDQGEFLPGQAFSG